MTPLPAVASPQSGGAHRNAQLALLDSLSVPAGTVVLDTPFGGISGIDYRPSTDSYVVISDDRSENAPARYYELKLPLAGDRFASSAPQVTKVTQLRDADGATFARRTVDPESILFDPSGDDGVIWTSEGAAAAGIAPSVSTSAGDGHVTGGFELPTEFVPQLDTGKVTRGARDNQSLESLAVSPDGTILTTAVENALVQDGPAASLNASSPSRLVRYDRTTKRGRGRVRVSGRPDRQRAHRTAAGTDQHLFGRSRPV